MLSRKVHAARVAKSAPLGHVLALRGANRSDDPEFRAAAGGKTARLLAKVIPKSPSSPRTPVWLAIFAKNVVRGWPSSIYSGPNRVCARSVPAKLAIFRPTDPGRLAVFERERSTRHLARI